jgi:hypothetical protein
VFTEAYSAPNAIVTKLDQAYPPSDEMSFVISFDKSFNDVSWRVEFYYEIDSEQSIDTGRIEFSFDGGSIWIDPLDDPLSLAYIASAPGGASTFGEAFSGVKEGSFSMDWLDVQYSWGIENVLIKFTFTSDANETNQAGWLIDDITIFCQSVGSTKSHEKNSFTLFPNPASNEMKIQSKQVITKIEIANVSGKLVLETTSNTIDISKLSEGIYYVKAQFFNGNSAYEKLVVTK